MRIRTLAALLLLSALAVAQDSPAAAPLSSPKALWFRYQDLMKEYFRTNESDALVRAGRLFDMTGVADGDRDNLGVEAATDLWYFLQRAKVIYVWTLPDDDYSEPTYVIDTPKGDVVLDRDTDGSWRFSNATFRGIGDLKLSVFGLPMVEGAASDEVLTTPDQIRSRVPSWMLDRPFLLENWQWAGLLALIFAGVIASTIAKFLIVTVGRRTAGRLGVKFQGTRRDARPLGIAVMAVLWYYALPVLGLSPTVHSILMVATRVILMIGVVWCSARLIDFFSTLLAGLASRTDTKIDDLLVPMLRRAVKIFVVVLGVIWIASNLGWDVTTLLAGLGIGGVAIALASKDTVENFFGAISILVDRPFAVGDWVVIGKIEGTVAEVGFRSSRVHTFYDSIITFPNAMLIRTPVDNMGRRVYRRIKETLGVAYDTPAAKMEAFLEGIREIIRRHPYTRKDYYLVYFVGYGDSALEILLYCFVKVPDWSTELREKQRLLLDILRLAQELGVEFAFPTRTLHMIQSNAADHSAQTDDVSAALGGGRRAARDVVSKNLGSELPPPATIERGPSDLGGDGGNGD